MINLTIDELINTFDRLNQTSAGSSELGEQDTGGESAGGTTTVAPTKWESQYQTKRGPANQVMVTKWKDSYPIKRGVANTLY